MKNSNKSILEYKISPYLQSAGMLGVMLIFNLVSKILGMTGLVDIDDGTPWLIATALTLFYVIGNPIMSLSSEKMIDYWSKSIPSYAILAIVGGLMAYLFAGVGMDAVGSYKWIYLVLTLCYILFLIIVASMRRIVKYAQKKDKRLRGEK